MLQTQSHPNDAVIAKPIIFKQRLSSMSYAGIPPLRQEMLGFLGNHRIDRAYGDKLSLTLSEILTNLFKHPLQKAIHIDITVTLAEGMVSLDVADDSTPFAMFDAKCNEALQRLNAAETLSECGYGLGCIMRQHTEVCYTTADKSRDHLNHFCVREKIEKRKVVFLIDDDPIVLKTEHRLLSTAYDVVPFHHARDALAMFKKRRPDVVISDLHMPEMDGVQLRRQLSLLPDGNTIPFVFLSGSTGTTSNTYINELGIDDFICKPITGEKLLNVVSRLLTRAKQVKNGLEGKFHAAVTDYLKPSLPQTYHGWNLSTFSRAAEAGGGDFTLYQEMPDCLFIVLADVMGHGLEAKFFSYAYAGYLRSLFRFGVTSQNAAKFLQHLSKTVEHDSFLESVIFTCQTLQLFPDGRIWISSAGHPAPLLADAESCKNVDIAGPLPGLAGDAYYTVKELQLRENNRLIFGTDGFFQVFEQPRDSAVFTEQSPHNLWNIFEERRLIQSQHDDDATMIIAEFGGNHEHQ